MIDGLAFVPPGWLWLTAALVLAILEIVIPGVFLIWLGAAAAITGLVTFALEWDMPFQLGLFAIAALAFVYAARRWFVVNPIASEDPLLNDRAARLVGRTVIVVEAIDRGEGRVRVGDGVWPACGSDAPVGAQVRIAGTSGNCLTVEPLA